MDFSDADRIDSAVYNRILWKGMMGNKPYPAGPTGLDLSRHHKEITASHQRSADQNIALKPKADTD